MLRINLNKSGIYPATHVQGTSFNPHRWKYFAAPEQISQHLVQRPRFAHGITGLTLPAAETGFLDLIDKHPLTSLVIAAAVAGGVFFLLGKLSESFRRRNDDNLGMAIQNLSQYSTESIKPDKGLAQSKTIVREAIQTTLDMFYDLEKCMQGGIGLRKALASIRSSESDLDEVKAELTLHFLLIQCAPLEPSQVIALESQRLIMERVERVSDHVLNLAERYAAGIPKNLPEDMRQKLEQLYTDTRQLFIDVTQGYHYGNGLLWHDIRSSYEKLRALSGELQDNPIPEESRQGMPQNGGTAQVFYTNVAQIYRQILGNTKKIAQAVSGRSNRAVAFHLPSQ